MTAAGLIKKDPTANGQAVPAKVGTQQGQAKHIPYCFFNVTWTIVPPGSIKGAAKAGGAPAPAPLLATAAKKPAATRAGAGDCRQEAGRPRAGRCGRFGRRDGDSRSPQEGGRRSPGCSRRLGRGGLLRGRVSPDAHH